MAEYTLYIQLIDSDGNPIEGGKLEISRVGDLSGPQWDHEVAAGDGPGAIQTALNSAASGETVRVNGSGSHAWDQSLEVPNGVTLDISNDIVVTVPSSHNVTAYSPGGANVYSLITNADRSSASNVTIRGGEFNLGNMPEDESNDAEYAGVWLHNCTDGLIDNVEVHGAGAAIFGSGTHRGFGLAMTNCTTSEIRDSAAFDSAYDDIAVRGNCQNCSVVRSGGAGGSSGTIQTAAWGNWGLSTRPSGTTFQECYGRRIYGHDDTNTTWDNCSTGFRLQTIGTDGAEIRNSTINGYVLLYTYSSATDTALVEDMVFESSSRQDAIQIGTNVGNDIDTVTVRNSTATRNRLLNFNAYAGTNGAINSVTFNNVDFTGEGSSPTIVNQESGASQAGTLRFEGCEFSNATTGITGTYGTVEVVNCTFNSFASEAEAINVTGTVTTSGNTYNG